MKTLEIEIRGTASEVVVGSLSKEELKLKILVIYYQVMVVF